MKNLILKFSPSIWLMLFLAPILCWYFTRRTESFDTINPLFLLLANLVAITWRASVIAFLSQYNSTSRLPYLSYLFLLLEAILFLDFCYFHISHKGILPLEFPTIQALFSVIILGAISLSIFIKSVLSERSLGFLFLELACIPFGIHTLTDGIHSWAKENRH